MKYRWILPPQWVSEINILMEPQGEYGLDGQNEAGIRMTKEEKAAPI